MLQSLFIEFYNANRNLIMRWFWSSDACKTVDQSL